MRAFDRIFAKGNDAKNAVKESFNASNLVDTATGDEDFMYAVADGFAMMDQYGSKQDLCDHLQLLPDDATDEDRVNNAGEVIAHHYGTKFVSGCFYDTQCIKNKTKVSAHSNDRPFMQLDRHQVAMTTNAYGRERALASVTVSGVGRNAPKSLTFRQPRAHCQSALDCSPSMRSYTNAKSCLMKAPRPTPLSLFPSSVGTTPKETMCSSSTTAMIPGSVRR